MGVSHTHASGSGVEGREKKKAAAGIEGLIREVIYFLAGSSADLLASLFPPTQAYLKLKKNKQTERVRFLLMEG